MKILFFPIIIFFFFLYIIYIIHFRFTQLFNIYNNKQLEFCTLQNKIHLIYSVFHYSFVYYVACFIRLINIKIVNYYNKQ